MQVFEEDSHYDLTRPLDVLQALVGECARRLVARRDVARADDVFSLTEGELRQWMLVPPPADARRALIERRAATYPVANARWIARHFTAAARGAHLSGAGASPGTVRARARLVRDVSEFGRLRPGDVLVCRATNPAWTILFASASAVVTETGGVTSHAAIVAREYGIPAVMGVRGALSTIRDGALVVVDGSAGCVRVLADTRGEEAVASP
jgi:pyruvate,water dikinase